MGTVNAVLAFSHLLEFLLDVLNDWNRLTKKKEESQKYAFKYPLQQRKTCVRSEKRVRTVFGLKGSRTRRVVLPTACDL